ncbi:MAG: phenylacetate-CoA oxygenase subunit PaaC [Crocinitomicaceae bacterium]|nr:phenylacetate-CoA oxygenase subunit PaaC [Crocinitomicaceae bacterium]MCF8433435.1 phenylacetate-CoA oxygenase subunit PaaC [Crocinitomicaceae bacterium]
MDLKLKYYLQIADNALILSHRLSEYCSRAPFLEEDLANTNVALDLIGIAEATLEQAAIIQGKGLSGDDLAYRRPENEFYNTLLVEQPNKDFAYIVVRQFLTDAYHVAFFSELTKSKDPFLSALAYKSIKEVTYHLRRSSEWMVRLGDGTEEAHVKVQTALDSLWKFAKEFFKETDADIFMQNKGFGADLSKVETAWNQKIREIYIMATLKYPPLNDSQVYGGKEGKHSEYLGHILAEMQFLPNKYPDAKW